MPIQLIQLIFIIIFFLILYELFKALWLFFRRLKVVKTKTEKLLEVNIGKGSVQSSERFLDLLMPLSLKLAFFDKSFHVNENKVIEEYFISILGFEESLTKQKIGLTITKLSSFKLTDAARDFSTYIKKSAPISVRQQVLDESYGFLNSIVEADENIDETEVLALEEIKRIFDAK
jgi:hypothetical protein